jgi:hypothetical protein
VVRDIEANIISVSDDMCKRRKGVQYTKEDLAKFTSDADSKVLLVRPYDVDMCLYHLDLVHLMLAPAPCGQPREEVEVVAERETAFAGRCVGKTTTIKDVQGKSGGAKGNGTPSKFKTHTLLNDRNKHRVWCMEGPRLQYHGSHPEKARFKKSLRRMRSNPLE